MVLGQPRSGGTGAYVGCTRTGAGRPSKRTRVRVSDGCKKAGYF